MAAGLRSHHLSLNLGIRVMGEQAILSCQQNSYEGSDSAVFARWCAYAGLCLPALAWPSVAAPRGVVQQHQMAAPSPQCLPAPVENNACRSRQPELSHMRVIPPERAVGLMVRAASAGRTPSSSKAAMLSGTGPEMRARKCGSTSIHSLREAAAESHSALLRLTAGRGRTVHATKTNFACAKQNN